MESDPVVAAIVWRSFVPGRGYGDDPMARISLDTKGADGLTDGLTDGVADDDRRRANRAGVTVRIDYATVDDVD